ncbi:hypothetical protein H632_c4666p0, partial [Helicosporidium sp. ATCC 50920]
MGSVVERQFACSLGTAASEGPGQPERLVCEGVAELPVVPDWAVQFGKYLPPTAIVVQVTLSQAPAPAELASVELGRGGHESSLELAAEAAWRCFATPPRGSDDVEADSSNGVESISANGVESISANGVESASSKGVESSSSSGVESASTKDVEAASAKLRDAAVPLSGRAVLAWPTKACGALRNAAEVQGRVVVAVDGD